MSAPSLVKKRKVERPERPDSVPIFTKKAKKSKERIREYLNRSCCERSLNRLFVLAIKTSSSKKVVERDEELKSQTPAKCLKKPSEFTIENILKK